jgi:putative serine/threonine protein kinase
VKILRVDASRKELQYEAKMLQQANSVQVGPKFHSVSKNVLVMELITGNLLPFWLESCSNKSVIKRVFKDIIDQCRRLDLLGLDHGELSKAPKHIIVNNELKPFIVDFETASIIRKVSNVTSICQFLFLSYGEVGKTSFNLIGNRDRNKIIRELRKYKSEKTNENYKRILQACFS